MCRQTIEGTVTVVGFEHFNCIFICKVLQHFVPKWFHTINIQLIFLWAFIFRQYSLMNCLRLILFRAALILNGLWSISVTFIPSYFKMNEKSFLRQFHSSPILLPIFTHVKTAQVMPCAKFGEWSLNICGSKTKFQSNFSHNDKILSELGPWVGLAIVA